MGNAHKSNGFGTRTVFGGGKVSLWLGSAAVGVAGGSVMGAIVFYVRSDTSERIVSSLTLGIVTAVIFTFLAWSQLVDRTTVYGAVEHAEASVENTWMQRSVGWGFAAVMAVNSVLIFLVAIHEGPITPKAAIIGLLANDVLGLLAWIAVYFLLKWKATR